VLLHWFESTVASGHGHDLTLVLNDEGSGQVRVVALVNAYPARWELDYLATGEAVVNIIIWPESVLEIQ